MLQSPAYSTRKNWLDSRSDRLILYAWLQGAAVGGCTKGSEDFQNIRFLEKQRLLLIVPLFLMLVLMPASQSSLMVAARGASNQHMVLSQNPIYQENQKPGTTSWQSPELLQDSEQQSQSRFSNTVAPPPPDTEGSSANTGASWRVPIISGYADQTSVDRGDTVHFYVSTSQSNYDLAVYRLGWYRGTGGRLLLTVPNLPGQNQSVPEPLLGSGLIECNWHVSYTLQTSSDWVSGVYLVKLTASNGSAGYITFVLRADGTAADILYQIPVTTYQAYNNWGGKSLYDFNSSGGRANKVSYDRPYYAWNGAGFLFEGDYNMLRWLESQNYGVTYVTSLDMQTNPLVYTSRKVFLSDWHDEYWSKEMRDNLTSALNQGENLAFFSANNMYWQIRFEPSTGGIPNRTQVCYKDASADPLSKIAPGLTTVNWRSDPVDEPENALLGVMYRSEIDYGTSFPWVVADARHWIYQGTGLKNGETIAGLIGYEYDDVWYNGLTPPHLTILSQSAVVDKYHVRTVSNGTIYTAASNALVFVSGTIYWPWKLDDNSYEHHGADRRVQRMTANVLNAMITSQHGVISQPATLQSRLSILAYFYTGGRNSILAVVGLIFLIVAAALTWLIVRRRRRGRRITS